MDISERFCPVCKNKNEREAVVCKYCGASLEKYFSDAISTTRNADLQPGGTEKVEELLIDEALIPAGGIAVYVVGTANPVFLSTDREFIIGRKMEETRDAFLDLSNLGGYLLGLSRRHARIRRVDAGYEVIDLGSTNGTWVNGERLTPNQAYPLASGSQLRLGRMRFFVLYRSTVKTKQKT